VVQVVVVFFYNFSDTLNFNMNCARNYENLLNFVSYAQNTSGSIFSGHDVVEVIVYSHIFVFFSSNQSRTELELLLLGVFVVSTRTTD